MKEWFFLFFFFEKRPLRVRVVGPVGYSSSGAPRTTVTPRVEAEPDAGKRTSSGPIRERTPAFRKSHCEVGPSAGESRTGTRIALGHPQLLRQRQKEVDPVCTGRRREAESSTDTWTSSHFEER